MDHFVKKVRSRKRQLLSLPAEVLIEVSCYLWWMDFVSLCCTCKYLYTTLSVQQDLVYIIQDEGQGQRTFEDKARYWPLRALQCVFDHPKPSHFPPPASSYYPHWVLDDGFIREVDQACCIRKREIYVYDLEDSETQCVDLSPLLPVGEDLTLLWFGYQVVTFLCEHDQGQLLVSLKIGETWEVVWLHKLTQSYGTHIVRNNNEYVLHIYSDGQTSHFDVYRLKETVAVRSWVREIGDLGQDTCCEVFENMFLFMKRGIAGQPGTDESVVSYNGVAISIRENVMMKPIDIQNAVYARGTIDFAELSLREDNGCYPIIVDTLRARCTDNGQMGKRTEWICFFQEIYDLNPDKLISNQGFALYAGRYLPVFNPGLLATWSSGSFYKRRRPFHLTARVRQHLPLENRLIKERLEFGLEMSTFGGLWNTKKRWRGEKWDSWDNLWWKPKNKIASLKRTP